MELDDFEDPYLSPLDEEIDYLKREQKELRSAVYRQEKEVGQRIRRHRERIEDATKCARNDKRFGTYNLSLKELIELRNNQRSLSLNLGLITESLNLDLITERNIAEKNLISPLNQDNSIITEFTSYFEGEDMDEFPDTAKELIYLNRARINYQEDSRIESLMVLPIALRVYGIKQSSRYSVDKSLQTLVGRMECAISELNAFSQEQLDRDQPQESEEKGAFWEDLYEHTKPPYYIQQVLYKVN